MLVDDSGKLLNWVSVICCKVLKQAHVSEFLCMQGTPTGNLPHISERRLNFETVSGSKYAVEAELKGQEKQRQP